MIFKKKHEMINLIAPLLLAPLLLAEFFFTGPLSLNARIFLLNFVEVGLGSAGHNGLSWSVLFLTPEGRNWLEEKGGVLQIVKIFFVACSIFAVSAFIFCFKGENSGFLLKSFLFVDWFLIHHHSFSQTRGLTIIYSHGSASKDGADKSLIEVVHRRMKFAFSALLVLAMVPALNYIFELPILNTMLEKIIYSSLSFLVIFWIMAINISLPGNQKNKIFFLSRLFYFPLTSFFFSAAIAFRFVHGIEYLFIFNKIVDNSASAAHKLRIFMISALFFICAILLWTFSFEHLTGLAAHLQNPSEIPLWLRVLAALSVTRLYMHYYLDRLLYQMRDPLTAKNIGPLVR